MSTVVTERFKVATYLNELIRKAQPGEPAHVEQDDVPPFAPTSAFVTADDEIFECELER